MLAFDRCENPNGRYKRFHRQVGAWQDQAAGTQRLSINAPPRSHVICCLRPDGDIYLRHPPDPKTTILKP